MNEIVAIAFLAIGSLVELLELKYPTPGQRVGSVAGVLSMSGVGLFVPNEATAYAIIGFAIANSGRIAARLVSWLVDKYRVWRVP